MIIKIENNEKLDENETLDIAFLPLFSPKNKAKHITRKVCYLYNIAKFNNEQLKNDISYILQIMINKNIIDDEEKRELLKLTFEEIRENALNELIKNEIDELKILNENLEQTNQGLEKRNENLEQTNQELKKRVTQYDKAIRELKKAGKPDDESLKIINSLIVEK